MSDQEEDFGEVKYSFDGWNLYPYSQHVIELELADQ